MADVRVNFRPLERLARKIETRHGPLNDVYIQWAARYRAFAKRRFVKASRGDGTWKDLSPVTKKRRRKARRGHKGPRVFAILRDTGTLFAALEPRLENPGSLKKLLQKGVRVGYGGSAKHPSGGLTIARLAEIHNRGLGRVPQRKIIVTPDRKTMDTMVRDFYRGIRKTETWVR